MGVHPAQGTAYTCKITQPYHIHNSPLPPHIWLCLIFIPSSQLSIHVSIYPSHANDSSSYHCSDTISGFSVQSWILQAVHVSLSYPPCSPCVTVVHKVVLGYIAPLHGLKILNVLARSALNTTKEFTLKCINSLHPTAHFPLFQSNIQSPIKNIKTYLKY
jgi:hypothetical protein